MKLDLEYVNLKKNIFFYTEIKNIPRKIFVREELLLFSSESTEKNFLNPRGKFFQLERTISHSEKIVCNIEFLFLWFFINFSVYFDEIYAEMEKKSSNIKNSCMWPEDTDT